jgi:hypothetical protein
MGELIDFPRPLSPDEGQRDYFATQASYWGEVEESSFKVYEFAKEQREYYLRMLGMLAVVHGTQE